MTPPALTTPTIRRAVFLGGHILALAAIVLLAVAPIRAALDAGEAEIAARAEALARLRATADRKPDAPSEAETAFAREAFLTGPNEGVAAANLQARLQSMAAAFGARVRSVQGVPPRGEGGLRMIGARLEMVGPLPAVHRAIHAIEAARPLLVTGAALKLSPMAAMPGGAAEPVLEAQLDILAAFRAEGGT